MGLKSICLCSSVQYCNEVPKHCQENIWFTKYRLHPCKNHRLHNKYVLILQCCTLKNIYSIEFFLVFYQKYWPALNLPDYFDISAIQVISTTFGNCIAFYTDNCIPQNVNENKRSNFKLIFEDEDNPMYRTHSVPYLWN